MDIAVNLAVICNIKVFSENMGHPDPIKIVIMKNKGSKLGGAGSPGFP